MPFNPDGSAPATAVQSEDAVTVPSFGELQQAVLLVGALAGATASDDPSATRRLPFVQGDSIRTLLERLGGVAPTADLTEAYILRKDHALPVNLYSLLMLRDFKADRSVELGDTIVVPFKRRNILVEGAVFAPGIYPYNPTFGVEQYLALAGGPNRYARPVSDVRLVQPNGAMKAYQPDLKLEPGASLVVPERDFSRAEIVQITLAAAGILLSGAAIYVAARK